MTKHTTRDRIWSAALKTAEAHEGKRGFFGEEFTASKVLKRMDDDVSARSVRDTLATMADLGHIQRGHAQGTYKPLEETMSRDRNDASGSASTSTKDRKDSSSPSTSDTDLATEREFGNPDHLPPAPGEEDQEDVQETSDVDVSELDLPGSGSTLEARRDAVRACYEFLREEGTATKADFEENVYPEHPGGYQTSRGWWNRVGLMGLRDLARRRDDIEAPTEGGRIWEYSG